MTVPSIIVIFGNVRDILKVFLNAPTIAIIVIMVLKSGLRACGIGNHAVTDREAESISL